MLFLISCYAEPVVWGDAEAMDLVEKLHPENMDKAYCEARNALLNKFGYGMMKDGKDYNLPTTIF